MYLKESYVLKIFKDLIIYIKQKKYIPKFQLGYFQSHNYKT